MPFENRPHRKKKFITGEGHSQARLSDADVLEIRKLRAKGISLLAIGELYGISASHVSGIAHDKGRQPTGGVAWLKERHRRFLEKRQPGA
jgi:hypothetical protein